MNIGLFSKIRQISQASQTSCGKTSNSILFQFWGQLFVPLNCLNLGVGGERTEQVLRRLKRGQLENMAPKVVTFITLARIGNKPYSLYLLHCPILCHFHEPIFLISQGSLQNFILAPSVKIRGNTVHKMWFVPIYIINLTLCSQLIIASGIQ